MKKIAFVCVLSLLFSCKTETKKEVKEEKNKVEASTKVRINIDDLTSIHLGSGSVQRITDLPSAYIKTRPVDVWLPDGYSMEKAYAVLYMHDGQMLFDTVTTWNKQEWKVDEIAGQLQKNQKTKDFIVVAVHNISEIRWNDYFPAKAMDFVSEDDKAKITALAHRNNANTDLYADNYLKFLVEELKPLIDSVYSVKSDVANTSIAGSSMGGLISMYAISEYPDVFGGAACISTHWPGAGVSDENPLPDAIFKYMEKNIPSPDTHRIYYDYGDQTLDQYYPQYASRVDAIMKAKGYDVSNFENRFFKGADHSENSWNQRLDIPFMFLLGK